jgi:hypothetical protein
VIIQDTFNPKQPPKMIRWSTATDATVEAWTVLGNVDAIDEYLRRTAAPEPKKRSDGRVPGQYLYVPPLRTVQRYNQIHDPKGKFGEGVFEEGPTVGGALSTGVDFAHLSAKGKRAVAHNMKHFGLTQPTLEKEIASKLTTQTLADGKEWYPQANSLADELATENGVTTEQAAGVIAALSPQTPWLRNEYLAERTIGMVDEYPDEMTAEDVADWDGGTLRENLIPAINIVRGKSIDSQLTGVKRRSLYNNIVNPYGTDSVVIDAWMQRSVISASSNDLSLDDSRAFVNAGKVVTDGIGAGYVSIRDAVRAVAADYGLPASQIQAAYWLGVKGASDAEQL